MKIPSKLARSLEGWPNPGLRMWVNALPDRIAELGRRWSVKLGDPYEPGGYTSIVAPAGPDHVVKMAFPWEPIRCEFDALRAWDGNGAVRLVDGEPLTFLMAVQPGTTLEDHETLAELFSKLVRLLYISLHPLMDGEPWTMRQRGLIEPLWAGMQ